MCFYSIENAIKKRVSSCTHAFFLRSIVMVNCCLVIRKDLVLISKGIKNKASCLYPVMCLLQDTVITTEKLHWALLWQTPLYIQLAERAGKVFSVSLNRKTLIRFNSVIQNEV